MQFILKLTGNDISARPLGNNLQVGNVGAPISIILDVDSASLLRFELNKWLDSPYKKPVHHTTIKLGLALCGADEPNQSLSGLDSRVTCPSCREMIERLRGRDGDEAEELKAELRKAFNIRGG